MNSLRVCISSDSLVLIITAATYGTHYVRCTRTRGSGGPGRECVYVI